MLMASWTPILQAFTYVISCALEEETHQVILRMFQSFTTMASTLDLVGPRYAISSAVADPCAEP